MLLFADLHFSSFNNKCLCHYRIDEELDDIEGIIDIINASEFSRLKEISQLGGIKFLHKNASHNKYDHWIGTINYAGKIIEGIKKNSTEFESGESDMVFENGDKK